MPPAEPTEESRAQTAKPSADPALKLMTVHTRHPPHSQDPPAHRTPRAAQRAARSAPAPDRSPRRRGASPQARERDAGGPEDLALYRCSCGYVFEAAVSTTVGCPHCGGTQAW